MVDTTFQLDVLREQPQAELFEMVKRSKSAVADGDVLVANTKKAQSKKAVGGVSRAALRMRSVAATAALDAAARDAAAAARIEALEADTYVEDTEGIAFVDADSEALAQQPTLKGRQRASATNSRPPPRRKLAAVIASELAAIAQLGNAAASASAPVSLYLAAAAAPSAYPPVMACAVCGAASKYGCSRCGVRYCRASCGASHREASPRCATSQG